MVTPRVDTQRQSAKSALPIHGPWSLSNISVRSPRIRQLFLTSVDTATVAAAFFLAMLIIRFIGTGHPGDVGYIATIPFSALWLVNLWTFGVYSLRHIRAGTTEYKRVISASVTTGGEIGVLCYLVSYEYPRMLFGTWMVLGVLTLCLSRRLRRRTTHRLHLHGEFLTPVLLAGNSRHVDEIARILRREQWLGYEVTGVVTDDRQRMTDSGIPVLGGLDSLAPVVGTTGAPVVIFAEGSFGSSAEFRRLAWQLENSDTQLVLAPTLADVSAERLEFRPLAGLPLVDVARPTAQKSLRWVKRTVDVLGSAFFLLLLSPVLGAAALAVKLDDGGPVLFRQRRVGLDGREFDCLKLRSMCVDAEARLAALAEDNEGAGVLFKMKEDPRITRVGKFIRRYSIDELPQLWNTLVGDMSLVGPRPALPSEVEQYDFDTRRRLSVRPGLTGLWQVSGRSSLSWEDTVRLDLYYVDNWSPVQDLIILLKTARAVVGSSGAY